MQNNFVCVEVGRGGMKKWK